MADTVKVCEECGKPLSAANCKPDKKQPDGLSRWCMSCWAAWNKAHPSKRHVGSRRLSSGVTMRSWDSENEAMDAFYRARPDGHDIDHVIPLVGKYEGKHVVSGLHVLANLRYLPKSENYSKGCEFDPAAHEGRAQQ